MGKSYLLSYNNLFDSLSTTYVNQNAVDPKLSQQSVFSINSREIKYRLDDFNQDTNSFILVNQELFENDPISSDIFSEIQRGFGNILHITLEIPDYDVVNHPLWIEAFFFDLYDYDFADVSTYFHRSKNLYNGTPIKDAIAIFKNTTYRLLVHIYDSYGSRETWFYDFEMSDDNVIIDVTLYNSNNIQYPINDILQGVTIPNNVLTINEIDFGNLGVMPNYVLPQSAVPQNLSQYYKQDIPEIFYLAGDATAKPVFTLANKRSITKNVTETIPIKMIDAFLSLVQVPYQENDELVLKVYDIIQGYIFIPYNQVSQYSQVLDALWIQRVEVFQQQPINSTTTPESLGQFWMIIGALAGLEMDSKHINFYIKRDNNYIPIAQLEGYQIDQIPLDYDIPMSFHPSFQEGYISQMSDIIPVLQDDNTVKLYSSVLSVFSHLTNIRDNVESFYLKLNDVLYAQLSPRYISFPFEVQWIVKDSFTHDILYETTDKTLKYRYKGFQVVDIEGNFKLSNINGAREFKFLRQSVASYIV